MAGNHKSGIQKLMDRHPNKEEFRKDLLDTVAGRTSMKAIAAKYGVSLNTVKNYRQTIKDELKVAEYSRDVERRTESRKFLDELFLSGRELLESVKKGNPIRDIDGKVVRDKEGNPYVDIDHKAWASSLGAATNLARLGAEIDGEIGQKAAAQELAKGGAAMGVQLCLVLPGPQDEQMKLVEGDVLDVEAGDVDYGDFNGTDLDGDVDNGGSGRLDNDGGFDLGSD